MHPHLPRNVGQYNVPVVQLHLKHGVGQRLDNFALYLYCLFLGHNTFYTTVRISVPFSPTATVCSKWADGCPSAVTTVQPSESVFTW